MANPAFRAADWANSNSFPGSTTASAPRPATTATGDGLVMMVYLEKIGATLSTPSGWTSLGQLEQTGGSVNFRVGVYTRVDDGTAGPYTVSWDGTGTWWFAQVASFSNVDKARPVNTSAMAVSASSTTVDRGPTVTTNRNNTMLVMLGANKTGLTATPPSGFTERLDAGNGYSASLLQASAGASGNADATLSSAAWNFGALVALNPLTPSLLPQSRVQRNSLLRR